ncbi:OST-HTH/LOTUS domain-containing protein [Streptomyces nigrescens]
MLRAHSPRPVVRARPRRSVRAGVDRRHRRRGCSGSDADASDDDGWAHLANVGHIITRQRPDFDSRTYGYAKLSDLLSATTLFEMDHRTPGDGKTAIVYARDKRHPNDVPKQATTEG